MAGAACRERAAMSLIVAKTLRRRGSSGEVASNPGVSSSVASCLAKVVRKAPLTGNGSVRTLRVPITALQRKWQAALQPNARLLTRRSHAEPVGRHHTGQTESRILKTCALCDATETDPT